MLPSSRAHSPPMGRTLPVVSCVNISPGIGPHREPTLEPGPLEAAKQNRHHDPDSTGTFSNYCRLASGDVDLVEVRESGCFGTWEEPQQLPLQPAATRSSGASQMMSSCRWLEFYEEYVSCPVLNDADVSPLYLKNKPCRLDRPSLPSSTILSRASSHSPASKPPSHRLAR